MDKHSKGYLYAVLSTLFLPTGYIINTIVFRSMAPVTAALYMFSFSLVMALAIVSFTGRLGKFRKGLGKYWRQMLLIGILTDIAALAWYMSLSMIGPSVLGFLTRFVTVFTVLFGVIFLKEKFNKHEAMGIFAVVIGMFIISYQGGQFAVGALLALVSSLAFSYMQLKIKIYVKHIDPINVATYRMLFTLPLMFVFAAMIGAVVPISLENAVLIAAIAFMVSILGFILLFKAYKIADLSKVAAIGSAEPLVILGYSFIVFGTLPVGLQLVGGAVILAGTFLLIYFRKKPKVPIIE